MDSSIKLFFKNALYTFTSNFVSFFINAMVVLILPKVLDINEFGYFQLYLLLATYSLYFHFGWCDGIYLRYVGKEYGTLNKEILSSQFKGICFLSFIILFAALLFVCFFINFSEKKYLYFAFAFTSFIVTPKTFFSVIMQMTNRMKEYSFIILAEKIVFAISIIFMLLINIRSYKILVLSDIVGKIAALLVGCYFCWDIIITETLKKNINIYWKEFLINIRTGIFLLVSNMANICITGIIQFSIETKWGIETFGKVSLTLNMSKMLLVVITAMSIVLVPMLKHMNNIEMKKAYKDVDEVLVLILGALLLVYYPLKELILLWLPHYYESIKFMAVLFPMCLFESKTSLLINPFMKSFREEKFLCYTNVFAVLISAVFAFFIIFVYENLFMTVLFIPNVLAIRCIILDFYLRKKQKITSKNNMFAESILAFCFIYLSWNFKTWVAAGAYIFVYLILLISKKNDVIAIIKRVKKGS